MTTSTSISYHDRGFRFGDGLFETISIVNAQPYLLSYHLERLAAGLNVLKIEVDLVIVKTRLLELIAHNQHENGLARIIISRGIGSLGYLPHGCPEPTVIIETVQSDQSSPQPVKICVSQIEKPSAKALPVSIKSLQGLNSTLAKMEACDRGYFEAILLNHYQQVCEVSAGNIFWVKNEQLYTPDAECGLVKGIMRRRIMEIFSVITGRFTMEDLWCADEVFITNISWIALPVSNIEDRQFNQRKMASNVYQRIWQEKNNTNV